MHQERTVETGFGLRKRRAVTDAELHTLAQSDRGAQRIPGLDILRSQVDARHPTVVASGSKAARSSEAAADVEHMMIGPDIELFEKTLSRRSPANVKLVHRTEIVDADRGKGLAKLVHPRGDGVDETALGVVGGNEFGIRHGMFSPLHVTLALRDAVEDNHTSRLAS